MRAIKNSVPLYRSISKDVKGLHDLLSHSNLFFWGDLDIEGMKIFERLKRRLPQLRLSGLYTPMVEAIKSPGNRHEYAQLACKPLQKPFSPQFEETAALLVLCSNYAVDQEFVSSDKIFEYAEKEINFLEF